MAFGGLSQMRLEFGEGLLDRIEVGAVRRDEQERCAEALDSGAHGGFLAARQVVHDDDVAAVQFRLEDTGHIGEERIGVHRPVEHPGGNHAGAT